MSIVSSHINNSMSPSSNLLHPLVHNDSSLKRKRYLEDLEPLEENKRARTAPPSPPLATVFTRRSLSPTPPSSSAVNAIASSSSSSTIKPLPSLALPAPSQKHHSLVTPKSSPLTLADHAIINNNVDKSQELNSSQQPKSTLLPSIVRDDFKYLKQNDRYGGISNHSLDYPDTCINDDDWRLNLELWIEKNFPEKFQNLKNLLRFDKPGFDLLNDAILLTELKEQLDKEHRSRKPKFTSKISKKMVSPKKYYQPMHFYNKKFYSDHSDDEEVSSTPVQLHPINQHCNGFNSSPIASTSQLNTSHSNFPYESNYTYSSADHTPTSPTSSSHQSTRLPPMRASGVKPLSQYQDRFRFSGQSQPESHHHEPSTHIQPPQPPSLSNSASQHQSQPPYTHNYQATRDILIETNNFIHTQNHKGPNHTYTIHHHNQSKRKCISCGSDQSPCWRPSWSTSAGQLCNSCGLRYKKTGARCMDSACGRIPAKGEWTAMKSRGKVQIVDDDGDSHLGYKCLHCGGEVEVKERASK